MSDFVQSIINKLENNKNNVFSLKEDVEQCLLSFDLKSAKELAVVLSNFLNKVDSNQIVQLKNYIVQLLFLALPLLYNDEQILSCFGSGFVAALRNDNLDIAQRLRAKFLDFPPSDRDIWRQNIVNKLHTNKDILTVTSINLKSGSIAGTIGNWLTVYDQENDYRIIDDIELSQYLFNSNTTKDLKKEERESLGRLLKFYEYLKLSSQSPLGLEEELVISDDSGMLMDFDHGRLVPILNFENEKINNDHELIINKPRVLKSSAPAFLFDEDDEKEADKYRSANNELRVTEEKPLEERLRDYAKEVVATNNLSFKDEVNARRFELLFVSRLKEVRNQVEVKESLMKLVAVGGLGLSEPVADKVADIIEKAKKDFESPIVNSQSSKVNNKPVKILTGKQEIDKLIAAELPVVLPTKPIALPEVKKTEPSQASVVKPEITVKPKVEPVKKEDIKLDRQKVLQQLARSAAASVGSTGPVSNKNSSIKFDQPVVVTKPKPQLTDVKAPSRLLGPLEELKTLTLVDFRRLAVKPAEALRKIQTKIELIGETSIAKKIEAIRSWQASEVYRNYLDLGRLSIERGKSISQILSEQPPAGQIYLTEEEFQAIVDFNEKLRF